MSMTQMSADEVDLSAPDFWARPDDEREAAFAALRRERPVAFFAEPDYQTGLPPGPGYWALTRFDDVWHASRHPEVFSSAHIRTTGEPDMLQSGFIHGIKRMPWAFTPR